VFNVHLDTVPSSPQWSGDPLKLRIAGDRAIGLGACDIKGAAAGLLAAAAVTDGDAAFLFTTDEEANDPRCIEAFLGSGHGYAEAIVAEPTRCEAVLAHRGIASVLLRFNIGRVEGGIKANMIAPSAAVRFNFRPLPSQDIDELHVRFGACAATGALERYEETFRGPSLPAGDVADAEERRLEARDLADALELPIGNAVDFWTEASLFSRAGMTAIVYGPGDIAQAHAADEWVALEQLEHYAASIARILSN
jgi:acetylornithine deacetylase